MEKFDFESLKSEALAKLKAGESPLMAKLSRPLQPDLWFGSQLRPLLPAPHLQRRHGVD